VVIVVLAVLAISGCGGSSSGSASSTPRQKLSPQQYANAQLVNPYVTGVNRVLLPFRQAQARRTDIGHAEGLLRAAIAQIKRLTPPTGFTKSNQDLLVALEAQLALAPQIDAAQRSKDSVALNNAQASASKAAYQTQVAIAAGSAEFARCMANKATC
jgi:hypothetical protein